MLELEENGLFHNGKLYRVKLQCFVCDAPARQFLKCIAGHCGRGACERCTALGVHMKRYHCMVFPNLDAPSRNNESFRDQDHPSHHSGVSPLERLENFDMVKGFPLDPMHLVLLGVFKRLLLIWAGKWNLKRKTHMLRVAKRKLITEKLEQIRYSYPNEFHRRFTNFHRVKSMKAVELRHLLLYTGPYIFKGSNVSKELSKCSIIM